MKPDPSVQKLTYLARYFNQHQLQIVRRELINRISGIFRHLKRFRYIRCDIILSFLIDSPGRGLSASCDYAGIRCIRSESAIISEIVVTPTNFQICGCRTALTSIQLTTQSGATKLPDKSAGFE